MTEVLSMASENVSARSPDKIEGDTSKMQLKLSDIIFILSPENEVFNNRTFFVDYIDKNYALIVDIDTTKTHKLRIHNTGSIGDGTIQKIRVLKRNPEDGYARQYGLLPGTWVNIYFNGDTPFVITAEITNLEEDMIEITSYPDNEVLYIDFGYKGIPQDLPINRFETRNAPETKPDLDNEELDKQGAEDEEYDEDQLEDGEIYEDDYHRDDEPLEELEETHSPFGRQDKLEGDNVRIKRMTRPEKLIQEYIISADERMLGEFLDPVTTQKRKSVSQERYDVQLQIDDLLDDMIMKSKKKGDISPDTMQRLKMETSRFLELRDQFSLKDEYGNVLKSKFHKAEWKPLVNVLENMSHPVK